MKRRTFIRNTGALSAGFVLSNNFAFASAPSFPVVRKAKNERKFVSKAVEKAITEFKKNVKDPELTWLFENCFPNTIDTTVFHKVSNGVPDTYVITGDIDAMWLRDSSAQVWPYLQFVNEDKALKQMIAGVINRQKYCVVKDPYANAFYDDPNKKGEWATDHTDMKPGVHERKWEIDSLCYPIRLAYNYWKKTGDTSPFDKVWEQSIKATLAVFKDQQRKTGRGSYKFQRTTPKASDTVTMLGYGYPVNPVGLICSAFRPSDDATVLSFLIPSNFFAVESLKEASEMMEKISQDTKTANELKSLALEVRQALDKYATVEHKKYGKVYAFETDGFGSHLIMDDANVPSLLSLPYLNSISKTDPIYLNTRKLLFSSDNPFFYKGKYAEGIGGPHIEKDDMIWHMSIIMRAMTSTSDEEIRSCIKMLKNTHGGTGFMHEGFHKDDPKNFTREWFAWTNTLFGELLWKTYKEKPHLLK